MRSAGSGVVQCTKLCITMVFGGVKGGGPANDDGVRQRRRSPSIPRAALVVGLLALAALPQQAVEGFVIRPPGRRVAAVTTPLSAATLPPPSQEEADVDVRACPDAKGRDAGE